MMKLWLIARDKDDVDWDEYEGFVVRAESEAEARIVVASKTGDGHGWSTFPNLATVPCTETTPDGPVGVILASFKSG